MKTKSEEEVGNQEQREYTSVEEEASFKTMIKSAIQLPSKSNLKCKEFGEVIKKENMNKQPKPSWYNLISGEKFTSQYLQTSEKRHIDRIIDENEIPEELNINVKSDIEKFAIQVLCHLPNKKDRW